MHALIAGFGLGLGLIVAIGAQNAFILKQGLKRQHVFVLCLICALSDAVLIVAGVYGLGYVAGRFALVSDVARYGGAAFLVAYGLRSFRAAFSKSESLQGAGGDASSLRAAVLVCLAFTWLNPHVYLDTFFLIGTVSTQYADERALFALGATAASFAFFFSLGYGARLLAPLCARPAAWRVLDVAIGCVMFAIAASLLRGGLA